MNLSEVLEIYIQNEMNDAAMYRNLAAHAPDDVSRDMLLEFAEDEKHHADEFQIIYHGMTGKMCTPEVSTALAHHSYRDALGRRFMDEGRDYRNYMKHYNSGIGDALLLSTLLGAGVDENLHGLGMLYLLSRL